MDSSFLSEIVNNISVLFGTWEIGMYIFVCSFIFISLVLLSVLSFFETSFFSLDEKEISDIRFSQEKKNSSLKYLLESPLQTLGTIVISYYFLLIAVTMVSMLFMQHIFETVFLFGLLRWVLTFISITFVLLLFGEIFPELLRRGSFFSFLRHCSRLIRFLSFFLSPFVSLLLKSTSIIERRLEAKKQHCISIDELSETLTLTAVETKDEKEILQGIVNFGRINVEEIMKPRVDIVDIDLKSDFDSVIKIIRESEYSRLPVYEDSIDNIKGILYIKDLLKYLEKEKSFNWQFLIRKAYFVPETKKIDDLLREFQLKHIHMAIVVDEFGGTSGIVTLEDILEVIVGDISDEHDVEKKMYTSIDDRNYILEGKLLLNDFYKIENVEKEQFVGVNSNADTLAGLILEIKGDIPLAGEKIEHNGYIFQILSADNRRIKRIRLQIP